MVRPGSLAGNHRPGRCCWCYRFSQCPDILCPDCLAAVGAAGLDLRTGLDCALCPDGYRRVAGLAHRRVPKGPFRPHTLSCPACCQCHLELAVFFLASRSSGPGRCPAPDDPHSPHVHRLLTHPPPCRLATFALFLLGIVCCSSQLCNLAAQSPYTGLTA